LLISIHGTKEDITPLRGAKTHYMASKPILTGWQDAYIDFLANPTESRTNAEFCKEWDISAGSLYVWRAKNHEMVYGEADKRRQQYKSQLREQAFKALAKRLEKSDKAIELALTLTGDLEKQNEVTNYHLWDPNEKREKAREFIQKLKTKQETSAPKGNPDGVLRPEGTSPGAGTP